MMKKIGEVMVICAFVVLMVIGARAMFEEQRRLEWRQRVEQQRLEQREKSQKLQETLKRLEEELGEELEKGNIIEIAASPVDMDPKASISDIEKYIIEVPWRDETSFFLKIREIMGYPTDGNIFLGWGAENEQYVIHVWAKGEIAGYFEEGYLWQP